MPAPTQSNNELPIPVAVLGSGSRARRLLALLADLRGTFRITGFHTSDATRRAALESEGLGRGFDDAVELCSQSRLALVTGLPDTHLSQSLIALEAGCDLVVEKPVALNVEDVSALHDAAQRLGRKAFVFHPHRFQDGLNELAELGRSSKVLSVRLTSRRFRHASRYTHPARRDPLHVGPGPLWDMGVHLLDLLDFVMPTQVISAEGTHKTTGLDFPLFNTSIIQGVGVPLVGARSGRATTRVAPTSENQFPLHIEINDAAPGRPRFEMEISTERGRHLWANGRLVRGPLHHLLLDLRPKGYPVRDKDVLLAVAHALQGVPDPRLATLESAVRVTGNLVKLHPPLT